jgi:hypothetical protein
VAIRRNPPGSGGVRKQARREVVGGAKANKPAEAKPASELDRAHDARSATDILAIDESEQLEHLQAVLGEERLLSADTHAAQASTPMALRVMAMQEADALAVDSSSAASLLDAAKKGVDDTVDPELGLLHKKSKLKGAAAQPAGLDGVQPLKDTTKLEGDGYTAQGDAQLGLKTGGAKGAVTSKSELDGGTQTVNANAGAQATGKGVKVDAGGQLSRERTLDDGSKVAAQAGGGLHVDESGNVKVDAKGTAGVDKELSDGSTVKASGQAGVSLAGGQVNVDVGVDAQRSSTVEETLADGGKRTTTTVEKAKGSVKSMDFSGERSTTVKTERALDDGVTVTDETRRGVRGSFKQRSVEGFYGSTHARTEGDVTDKRIVEGTAGLKGVKGKVTVEQKDASTGQGQRRTGEAGFDLTSLSVGASSVDLDREVAPDGTNKEVQRGVEGKGRLHRLGFDVDVQFKDSDGQAGSRYQGGDVRYDPTGLSVGRTHGHQDATGESSGGREGVKLKQDQMGVTIGRDRTQHLTERETLQSSTTFDLLLGNRKASGAVESVRTRSKLDDEGVLQQTSTFARVAGHAEAYREVADKGPATSDAPELAGKHVVELHQKVEGGGGAFVGQLSAGIGLYGGLQVSKGSEVFYRTHQDPERAAASAKDDESRSLAGRAKRRIVGASLTNNRLALPDLSRPDTLKVHDVLEVHTRGSVDASVGVLAFGLRGGVQTQLKGEFALRVKKTAKDVVELDVTPTRLTGMRANGGVVLADLSAGRVSARALRQTFRFDLSSETGRAAYQRALHGELPGGLAAGDVSAKDDGMDAFARADMPAGVSRLRLEKLEVRETDVKGQAGWMFVSVGRRRAKRTTDHVVTDGEVAVNLHGRTVEQRRKTLLSGDEVRGVTGSLRGVTALDADGRKVSTFDSLTLTAQFSDSKLTGRELNRETVDDVNACFGLALPQAERKGKKESSDVQVSVKLLPDALGHVAGASDAQLEATAEARGASVGALRRLRDDVALATDPTDAARAVQSWVADHGVEGMGAVVHLADLTSSLELKSASSAYDKPLESAKTLRSRWESKPWSADASRSALRERWGALVDTQDALLDGVARAADDPFLASAPAKREALQEQLTQQAEALEPLLDLSALSHADALTIYQKVDRGWTSKRDARLLARLHKDVGFTRLDAGLRTAKATSVRTPSEGVHIRTKSVADRRLLTIFGDERTQVSAQTRTVRGPDGGHAVDGMRLVAEIVDERSRGSEVNQEMVADVNAAFGTKLAGIGGRDRLRGSRRTLTVERTLDASDLERLGSLAGPAAQRAARGAPSSRRVVALADKLRAQPNDQGVAWAIEAHVQKHGLDGMGDVHRLLGGEVIVTHSTDAHSRAAVQADEVLAAHTEPLQAGAKNKDIAARFEAVHRAWDGIGAARAMLATDTLLSPEQKAEAEARLEAAEDKLDGALDTRHLSHDDAARLVAQLERGWTSRYENKAIERLREDAGLTSVTSKNGTIVASAVRERAGGVVEIHSAHSRPRLSSGAERLSLEAVRSREPGAPLTLSATFHDSKEKDGDLSGDVVARLNQAYGLDLSPARTTGDGSARSVVVRSTLDGAALGRVIDADGSRVVALARECGVDRDAAAGLVRALKRARDDEARAGVVQRFATEQGLAGMGLVHQLALSSSPAIKTTSGGYDRAAAAADEALLLYAGSPLRADAVRGEVIGRDRVLGGARDDVISTLERVRNDPLLGGDERAQLTEDLTSRLEALDAASDTSHLDAREREALAALVTSGWDGLRHRGLAKRLRATS